MDVVRLEHAREALDLIVPQLVEAGAEGELAYGLLNRLADEPDAWGQPVTMLVGTENDAPIAFVIRTGRHLALIVGFVDADEIDYSAFVREMLVVDHVPTAVNGAVRCSEPFAAAWAHELDATARTVRDLRAFELHRLRHPRRAAPGSARIAAAADSELLMSWCEGFGRDIDEPLEPGHAEKVVARFVENGDMLLWETDAGPVSMAAINRRTPSSSCVSWVYTPSNLRGQGYASAVVAALSQRELDAGATWCSLFTDLANPTSNKIYAELGYEPRCDYRHIELVLV